ncbi:MAG TPA: DUF4142 domain-containing protein [Mucilaginibacter sp.]|jgi:putative membrane protein
MKNLSILLITPAITGLLLGCNNTHKTDSKATADTLNNMKDSVSKKDVSITKELVMKVSHDDARFAVAAADGGQAEVALGQLASDKGNDSGVKEYAAMMVKDHSVANEKLIALAKKKGISLPASLSEFEQKTKDKLAAKSGKDFDNAYVDDMVEDHQKDIQEFTDASKNLKDPDLKAFVTETLPILKMHLAAIQKVKAGLK